MPYTKRWASRGAFLGNEPMNPREALFRFDREHKALLGARIYLYRLHIEALSKNEPVARAHVDYTELLEPEYSSPHDYFLAHLFVAHLSAFELFLQSLAAFVIRKHPKKVGSSQFRLADILDANGQDDLIQRAIEERLNKLAYKKPLEYLNDLADLLSIDPKPFSDAWRVFIEAKARRDLGVHNGWICNAIYIRKLAEAGIEPKVLIGQSALPVANDYLASVPNTIWELATALTLAVVEKHGGDAA